MQKTIHNVFSPRGFHWVGDGFKGGNYEIPQSTLTELMDPFLMVGFSPPNSFKPAAKPRGVGAHPHAGFETVTLVYQGELAHADSAGNRGTIPEGGLQWMTAGRGLLHEEFHSDAFTRNGGTLSMSQLWVNLPAAEKKTEPSYQDIQTDDIPEIAVGEASKIRVIAGSFNDVVGPAATHTPILILDIHANPEDPLQVHIPAGFNSMILAVEGSALINDSHVGFKDIAIFEQSGDHVNVVATEQSRFILLAGEPIEETVVQYGPFVASSRSELMELFDDYESGKMGTLL